jgi:beta-phosphoglucomutase-like phosphatase (HAD superfamily)
MGTVLQAVVFDMDGVIIESEMTHYLTIKAAILRCLTSSTWIPAPGATNASP